jgi:hypothetical protein
MKKLTGLLLLAVIFLFSASAVSASERSIAIQVLKTKEASQKRFLKSKMTAAGEVIVSQRAQCLEDIVDRIETEMPEEERLEPVLSLINLVFTESIIAIGQFQDQPILKEAAILNKKANKLSKNAKSKQEKVLVNSLRNHVLVMKRFIPLSAKFPDGAKSCQLKEELNNNNGYVSATAFLAVFNPFIEELNSSAGDETLQTEAGVKQMRQTQKIMKKIRPKISKKRINRYSQFIPVQILALDSRLFKRSSLSEKLAIISR